MRIDDLKAYLNGTWTLDRVADDRRHNTRYTMTGQAVFAPAADGLTYRERVAWRVGDQDFHGYRIYHLGFPAPGEAVVCFEDGRLFHTLDLRAGADSFRHHCPPDCYDGHYRVLDPDSYEVTWTVTGPRKHLRLVTRYVRTR